MTTTPAPAPPPLGLGARIGYGFGSVANGVGLYALAGSVLQLYFNQVIGLPAVLVGTVLMLTILVDAVVDPLIGWWSDRFRSRWGRRHLMMYASALPTALGIYVLWHAPQGLAPAPLVAFMISALLFVRIAGSFFEIPSQALAPELAPGYDERTSLFAWRFVFLVLGGAFINFVLYQVFLRQDAANPEGILNAERYADFGVFAAVAAFVAIVASTAATHSRIPYLHVPKAQSASLRTTVKEVAATFSNRPLLILMVTNMLIAIAAGVTAGLSSYMYVHLWGMTPQRMSYVLSLGPFASFISLWLAPWLARRFGKKPVMLGFYLSWLVAATVPFSAWLLGLTPPAGSDALLIFLIVDHFAFIALAVGVHIVLNSMLSDASEDIAVQTGRRSEGVMFAAYGLLAKIGQGGGAFVAGLLLTLVSFPAKAKPGTVSLDLMRELVLVNLPTVAFFNLAAIACAFFFSIDRKRHEANLAALRARQGETAGRGDDPDAPDAAVQTAPT